MKQLCKFGWSLVLLIALSACQTPMYDRTDSVSVPDHSSRNYDPARAEVEAGCASGEEAYRVPRRGWQLEHFETQQHEGCVLIAHFDFRPDDPRFGKAQLDQVCIGKRATWGCSVQTKDIYYNGKCSSPNSDIPCDWLFKNAEGKIEIEETRVDFSKWFKNCDFGPANKPNGEPSGDFVEIASADAFCRWGPQRYSFESLNEWSLEQEGVMQMTPSLDYRE